MCMEKERLLQRKAVVFNPFVFVVLVISTLFVPAACDPSRLVLALLFLSLLGDRSCAIADVHFLYC